MKGIILKNAQMCKANSYTKVVKIVKVFTIKVFTMKEFTITVFTITVLQLLHGTNKC